MKKVKQLLGTLLSGILCVSLIGCGKDAQSDSTVPADKYAYVPEYVTLPSGENQNINSFSLLGSKLYFSGWSFIEAKEIGGEKIFLMDVSVKNSAPVEMPIQLAASENIIRLIPDEQGNIYILSSVSPDTSETGEVDWEKMQSMMQYKAAKRAADGSEIYNVDITELIQMDKDNSYLQEAAVDKDGNLYFSNGSSHLWVLDKEGKLFADISLNAWIYGMGSSKEKEVYFLQQGAVDMEVCKVDLKTKSFSQPLTGLPQNILNTTLQPGINKGLLMKSDISLFEYDIQTQTYEEVINWIDNDINGKDVRFAGAIPDGRIFVFTNDGDTNQSEMALLTRKEAPEGKEKTILTLGTFGQDSYMQEAVVKFNRSNAEYQIEVKDYAENIDYSDENSYTDALTRFNIELISDMAPDIISIGSFSVVNVDLLVSKGIAEDLNPFLDKSTVVSRDQIVDSVRQAYTKDDVLVAIPSGFSINTLMGSTEMVGDASGWTLKELQELAAGKPDDAVLFDNTSKGGLFQIIFLRNEEQFVDWSAGTCNFNSDEFIEILEFANTMPDVVEFDNTLWETQKQRIQEGKLLLTAEALGNMENYQIFKELFGGSVNCIGFPNEDRKGNTLNGSNTFAICSKSKNKDAAWSFIESFLTEEYQMVKDSVYSSMYFPTLKSSLDKMMEKSMEAAYQLDMNGNIMNDENGVPIQKPKMTWVEGNLQVHAYASTQEEVDGIREIINNTTKLGSHNFILINIMGEEIEAFFQGQKTAKEAAEIIQNRVQIYVNENK